MNNKITFEAEKEFKRLTGTYSDDFFLILVEFTHKLNNSKSKLVASQAPNILRGLNTFVSNFESLYPLLKAAFPGQLTLSPEDFHDQLIIQYTLKEAHQCHQLMKNIKDAIPDDVEVQRFVSDIFKQRRYDISLHQFLIKIGKRIIDEIDALKNTVDNLEKIVEKGIKKEKAGDELRRQKDDEIDALKNTVVDLEKVVEERIKKEGAGDELRRQKDDEIDTLKNTVANLEKIVEERIKKEKAGDKLRRQKDDENDALKNTVIDLKKAVEENASKEQEFIELNRQKDESIKNLNDVVKRMEGEVTKLKQEKISIDLDKIRNEKIDELKDTIEKLKADNAIKARAAVELTRHTIDINEVKDEKIDNLENTIEQWTADDTKNEGKTDELSRQKDREIKKLNDILKEIKDELRTSEQTNENLKAGNATLTQEAGKLQKTIENKKRIIEREQSKCTSLRSRLQKAINNQCDDRCKKLHQEQLDRLNTNFEKILKKRANIMVDDSIEEARVMKNLSQFKPDTQLKRLNFKDATFLKDQDNIDLNKVNKESAKRKGNTASPVATKRVRSS